MRGSGSWVSLWSAASSRITFKTHKSFDFRFFLRFCNDTDSVIHVRYVYIYLSLLRSLIALIEMAYQKKQSLYKEWIIII